MKYGAAVQFYLVRRVWPSGWISYHIRKNKRRPAVRMGCRGYSESEAQLPAVSDLDWRKTV